MERTWRGTLSRAGGATVTIWLSETPRARAGGGYAAAFRRRGLGFAAATSSRSASSQLPTGSPFPVDCESS
jgi:hypothetical protein